jgi:hypothetical protein
MTRRISQVLRKKRDKGEKSQALTIWLDKDSVQRLERLKRKFKRFDDSKLIDFALKSLELQMNRILKRRVLRRIRALENKGLSSEQIADHLNKGAVPVPGETGKWNERTIARLSGEDKQGILHNSRK